jgi:hypothetical protein
MARTTGSNYSNHKECRFWNLENLEDPQSRTREQTFFHQRNRDSPLSSAQDSITQEIQPPNSRGRVTTDNCRIPRVKMMKSCGFYDPTNWACACEASEPDQGRADDASRAIINCAPKCDRINAWNAECASLLSISAAVTGSGASAGAVCETAMMEAAVSAGTTAESFSCAYELSRSRTPFNRCWRPTGCDGDGSQVGARATTESMICLAH